MLGAIVINYLKTYFTGEFPDYWLFFLGGVFVASTLFLPKGIVGTVPSFSMKRSAWLMRLTGPGRQPAEEGRG